jgi:hypothetical protein
MNNLEWLWMNNMEFDALTASVPAKLASLNYLLMLGRTDAEKVQAAELCVHDVLGGTANPNIVIICPAHLVKSRYSSLLWDMGVEFKCFGVYEKSLNHISDRIANYCLVSAEKLLRDGAESVLAKSEGITWDLMVIDMPEDSDADIDAYIKAVKTPARKLLISAPASRDFGDSYEKLSALVKAVLSRKKKGDKSAEYPFDEQRVIKEDVKTGEYNLKTISYKIPEALIAGVARVVDADSDIPLYKYGGNIFEEYNIGERNVYLGKTYDEEQLLTLIAADAKLEAFLKETDELLTAPENTIAVYCTASNTKDFVNKAMSGYYAGKNIGISDGVSDGGYLCADNNSEPRIIITDDTAGDKFLSVNRITHIINYEYPENPAVLERRYYRGGRNAGNPVFCIFCDDDNKFDGRMLRKTVLSNLDKAFNPHVAAKSLLWGIENIEEHLIVLILDLKYMSDFATEEAVESFRIEYCASDATDAASAAKVAGKRLEMLVDLFGQHHVLETKEVDGERLFTELSEKIAAFKNKCLYIDKPAGGILTIAEQAEVLPGAAEKPGQVASAVAFVNRIAEEGKAFDYALIRSETEKLSDSLKLSALINLWKYYRFEKKIARSYKEFMEHFNKGVI